MRHEKTLATRRILYRKCEYPHASTSFLSALENTTSCASNNNVPDIQTELPGCCAGYCYLGKCTYQNIIPGHIKSANNIIISQVIRAEKVITENLRNVTEYVTAYNFSPLYTAIQQNETLHGDEFIVLMAVMMEFRESGFKTCLDYENSPDIYGEVIYSESWAAAEKSFKNTVDKKSLTKARFLLKDVAASGIIKRDDKSFIAGLIILLFTSSPKLALNDHSINVILHLISLDHTKLSYDDYLQMLHEVPPRMLNAMSPRVLMPNMMTLKDAQRSLANLKYPKNLRFFRLRLVISVSIRYV